MVLAHAHNIETGAAFLDYFYITFLHYSSYTYVLTSVPASHNILQIFIHSLVHSSSKFFCPEDTNTFVDIVLIIPAPRACNRTQFTSVHGLAQCHAINGYRTFCFILHCYLPQAHVKKTSENRVKKR